MILKLQGIIVITVMDCNHMGGRRSCVLTAQVVCCVTYNALRVDDGSLQCSEIMSPCLRITAPQLITRV